MSRNGLNIYKRKDGRYEGRYIKDYENNKVKYGYVYAKSYSEIKDKLLNINNIEIIRQDVQFLDIANEWLSSRKIKVKESTYVKYYTVIEKYIKHSMLNTNIKEIVSPFLIDFTNELIAMGLSTKTIKDILCIIGMVIKYYTKTYNEKFNVNIVYPKSSKTEIDILTDNEIKVLEQYLVDNIDYKKLGILLTLYTGLRIGEICSLKWRNINLQDGYIVINKTIQRIKDISNTGTKIIEDEPKSNTSNRQIPLQDYMIKILSDYKCSNETAYLLTCTSKYIEPRTYQNYFKKCLRECNIRNVNYHVLRHTFATRCIANGFDIKSLSEILGHANINITLDKYIHPSFEDKKLNMNKLISFTL